MLDETYITKEIKSLAVNYPDGTTYEYKTMHTDEDIFTETDEYQE